MKTLTWLITVKTIAGMMMVMDVEAATVKEAREWVMSHEWVGEIWHIGIQE